MKQDSWGTDFDGVVSRVHPTFHFSAKSLQISAIQQLALRGYSETAQI